MNNEIKERLEKIEEGIVPEGYKETKVGIIPEDWEVKKLSGILKVKHGKSQKEVEVENGKYPILGTGGIIGTSNNYLFNKESVLIGRKGTIDKPYYMNEPFWTIDTLFYTDINDIVANIKYIFYKFHAINWYKYNEASGVPSLSASTIESIQIPTPPLQEQEKIANILSTWDKAIETIERLIEEKETQKKGLMQELLTGKTRLPGFNGEWEEVKLGEVTECLDSKRKPINRKNRMDMKGDIPYYGANGIVDHVNSYIFNERLILLAEDGGNFNEFYEKPIAIKIEGKSWVNNHAHVLKPIETVSFDFIFYSLEHKDIRRYINGTTRLKLNRGEMELIRLSLPPLPEQKAIAEILSTADKEIELLKQLLENKKEEKKGLMQLLLTGIVRV